MTSLEQAAKREWLSGAAQVFHGACTLCERLHDEDGKPLIVVRRAGSRRRVCLDCFDQGARKAA